MYNKDNKESPFNAGINGLIRDVAEIRKDVQMIKLSFKRLEASQVEMTEILSSLGSSIEEKQNEIKAFRSKQADKLGEKSFEETFEALINRFEIVHDIQLVYMYL
jgi:predicted nuclease with TOPRIM domain